MAEKGLFICSDLSLLVIRIDQKSEKKVEAHCSHSEEEDS